MVELGEQLQVTGKALKVRFRAETGFTILSADIQTTQGRDSDATLVGMMPPIDAGDAFEADLLVQEHPEYGYQYKVLNLFLKDDTTDMTEEGIMAYLQAKVAGVGPKLSKRIVDYFGQQTFEVIELDPEKLLQVPGVTRSTILKVQASWDERHGERKLITGLQSLGLSVSQAQRAMKQFGSMALEVLKDDLYHLTEVEGIGFQTADRLALEKGMEPTDPRRLMAAAVYAMQQAMQQAGHTYLPKSRALKGLKYYTGISEKLAETSLQDALEAGRILQEGDRVYLPFALKNEKALANVVAELLSEPPEAPWRVPTRAVKDLSEEQARVLEWLTDHRLVVLSGGPGTGKSYTTRKVVELAENLGLEVGLCAPTGKAARRLMEMTLHPASTIHRLLSYGPEGFRFGQLEPLPYDLIIVDEVSMCGDGLMLALLTAVAPGARILLVGDADQLPPVDYGMPLSTLTQIAPTVWLTQIYRQAQDSPIIRAAHQIKSGNVPEFSFREFRHIPVESDTGARRVALLVDSLGGPRKVQVLTPMKKGPLGVVALNQALQSMFNPGSEGTRVGEYLLRVGDIVVQTKNDYNNEVFNGTLGLVIREGSGKVQIDFEGNVVEMSGAEVYHLHLGYALTVHRSQGSEWDTVVGVLHDTHYNMLSRELAYTAVTRAKNAFVAVGTENAWQIASTRRREVRYTGLLDRIKKILG